MSLVTRSKRLRDLASRLAPTDRQALENGFYCTSIGPRDYRPRAPKPAPPHQYRATKITTQEGLILRCRKSNCQDQSHAARAALGFE